jgi:hypothetical protein
MSLWNKEYCPLCGSKLGMLSTIRIKNEIGVCNKCFYNLDIDLDIAKFQTVKNLAERLQQQSDNFQKFQIFNTTREVKIGGMYFRDDNQMKRWYVSDQKTPHNPTLYRYDEIADFKIQEDGDTITSGGLGRALVGGALFGGVGAVVGAVTGRKKTKKIVSSLNVIISLNNAFRNNITICCLSTGPCKVGSLTYNAHMQNIQKLTSFLDSICSQATQCTHIESVPPLPTISLADEILKYKELMDKKIITEEEFELKKKSLLGL